MEKDSVLLKIHRNYSKDESIKYLFEKIKQLEQDKSDLNFRIGELKSENSELEDKIKLLEKKKNNRFVEPEWKESDYVKSLEETIKKIQKNQSDKSESINKWRNMYFDILARFEKFKNQPLNA